MDFETWWSGYVAGFKQPPPLDPITWREIARQGWDAAVRCQKTEFERAKAVATSWKALSPIQIESMFYED